MLGQSAASSLSQTMEWYLYNPIIATMPAPYIWWDPSRLSSWTSQPGGLYNYGTANPGTIGLPFPQDEVVASSWTPPGVGSALFQIDDATSVDNDPLQIIPASDFLGGVTVVMVYKGDLVGGNLLLAGIGGVGFMSMGSPTVTRPALYNGSTDLGNSGGISLNAGNPPNDNFQCLICSYEPITVAFNPFTKVTLYQNGILQGTENMAISYASNASSQGSRILGQNQTQYGSLLRFNYVVNQTQVTTITDYMRTIWGTLA